MKNARLQIFMQIAEKSAGRADETLKQLPPTNQMSEGFKVALKASCTGLASANENMLTETRYRCTFKCCQ
jgi:hypothetical protein